MKKQTAIKHFGSVKDLAKALGVEAHAIYMWPEKLNQKTIDQINGAALRLGMPTLTKVRK